MPDSRPLPSMRGNDTYDDPPATSGPSSPYPNRHSRLRRALRNTSELAREISRDTPVSQSTAEGLSAARALVEAEYGYRHPSMVEPPGMAQAPRESAASHPIAADPATRSRRRTRERQGDGGGYESDYNDGEVANDSGFFSGNNRRKRRKLDVDAPCSGNPPIKYGHYGQVEAGKLKMVVISNDGGEHQDPRNPDIYLGAKNMLRSDKSVFCSVRNSAGVVLQHADGTAFCLEKLHVVGPENGFTAPVRAGLVYVSMDINSLQPYLDPPYHARRSGVHEPPYRQRTYRASPEQLSLSDALRDPEIRAAVRRHHDTNGTSDSTWSELDMFPAMPDSELNCDINESIGSFSSDQSLPVTLLSDEECGPEDSSTQEVIDYRLRRDRLMQRRREIERWDRAERWGGISNMHLSETERERERELERAENSWALNRFQSVTSRQSRQNLGSSAEETGAPPVPSTAFASSSVETPENGSGDPNVTKARFEIKHGKYKVAIKFDPPISGRYILLKMWSGRGNVDVQSVVPKGYGGPRFFPALQAL